MQLQQRDPLRNGSKIRALVQSISTRSQSWSAWEASSQDMPQNIAIFCDFDGTITRTDLTDAVLEAFALPEFKDWEQRWQTGEIGSQECLAQQVALIQADRADLITFARNFPIDEGIFALDQRCVANGAPLTIVSDGLDL